MSVDLNNAQAKSRDDVLKLKSKIKKKKLKFR